MRQPVSAVEVVRHTHDRCVTEQDVVVTEEPLEIRLGHGPVELRDEHRISVTMRTPGHDEELAVGFLFTEGIIYSIGDVVSARHCMNVRPEESGNVIRVELGPAKDIDPQRWQRNFYATSSCGVCGKSSIEAVTVELRKKIPALSIDRSVLTALPEKMRSAQLLFGHTGGIHAAALFDRSGGLLLVREDVGRHNAVDKVVGAMLRNGIDGSERILLVSGRAGFELVQKCAVAGIPVMASVGAPSSLAVELARKAGITLIGFLRGDRSNVYSGKVG